jgi:hypothetical protein
LFKIFPVRERELGGEFHPELMPKEGDHCPKSLDSKWICKYKSCFFVEAAVLAARERIPCMEESP